MQQRMDSDQHQRQSAAEHKRVASRVPREQTVHQSHQNRFFAVVSLPPEGRPLRGILVCGLMQCA